MEKTDDKEERYDEEEKEREDRDVLTVYVFRGIGEGVAEGGRKS